MKKMVLTCSLLAVVLLAGCEKLPRIINHDMPVFTAKIESFILSDSIAATFDCEEVNAVPEEFNGLDPAYPMVKCGRMEYPRMSDEESALVAVYEGGCAFHYLYFYVVEIDGQLILLNNPEKMRQTYAPIESPGEALSYAVAVTGYFPAFGQTRNEDLRYLQDRLEDTYIVETSNGYIVHLFYYRLCGCGQHTTYAVPVQVTRDGIISLGEVVPLFEDPSEDGICVD